MRQVQLLYQTEHFLAGFIGAAMAQLNAWANSGRLTSGPITRYRAGAYRYQLLDEM